MDTTYHGENDTSLSDSSLFHVFQPKQRTMAARLGFDPNLLDKRMQALAACNQPAVDGMLGFL